MNHSAFLEEYRSGRLRQAYLFHGTEEFVKERALGRVLSSLEESTRDLNVTALEDADADELRAACEAVPFFAERRIVIVKKLPVEEQARRIVAWLREETLVTTTLIYFIRGAADKRGAVFKAFEALGGAVEFAPLDEMEAARWAAAASRGMGVTMEPSVARHLIALTGTDMAQVNNELSKAADYVGPGGAITREVLGAVVTKNLEAEVFEMLRLILKKDAAGGMRALYILIGNGERPMAIAAFLAGRFRQMLHARLLLDQKKPADAIAKALGGNPYAAKKTIEAARGFDEAQLAAAARSFLDVGYLQVSGQAQDLQALELALFRLMAGKGERV